MQNRGITKNQLCWVIIRGFGIYLLVTNAISLVMMIILLVVFVFVNPDLISLPVTLPVVLVNLLSIAFGYHLLKQGRWLHRILNYEPSDLHRQSLSVVDRAAQTATQPKVKTKERVDPETQLTAREEQQFREWLSANPEMVARSEIDQLALFRDFLRDNQADAK